MPISIRDVAARANVSVGTVSKVLNNVPSRIPESTRESIRRTATEMGYQPNRMARSLGRRRTDTIGLMVSGLRNPFFVEIAEAAERRLLDTGYQVFLDASPSNHGTYSRHGKLRGWPVDGVLMWALPGERLAEYLGQAGNELPVVYLGYSRPDDPTSDVVSFDYYAGGRMLTEHLIGRGYGKRNGLLYLGPFPEENWATGHSLDGRCYAFLDTCAAHDIPARNMAVPDWEETREGGYAAGERILAMPPSERPDAVFCHNDVVAVGLYRVLRRAGVRVPEDIAVAGFDGIPEGRFLDAPLTTVTTSGEEMCRVAVELLLGRISGERKEPRQVIVPARLFVGGTT
jgi:LacI family transcriptional regulator